MGRGTLAAATCLIVMLSAFPGGGLAQQGAWAAEGGGLAATALPVLTKAQAGPALPAGAQFAEVVRLAEPTTVLPGPVKAGGTVPLPTGVDTIVSETFEGVFPSGAWSLLGSPTWDDTNYAAHGGSWSGWCGASSLSPAGGYTDNMSSWMIYGPFSLTWATDGGLAFWFKNYSEQDFDYFYCLASLDNSHFYGWRVSGDQRAWQTGTLDFKNIYNLGNICGQPQVWIGFAFISDASVSGPTYTGAYVDDILATKTTGTLPNLTPYTPSGWSNPIVVSKQTGTTIDDSPLLPTDTIYIDWAVINNGPGATAARFYVRLLLDGVEKGAWYVDPPLNSNWYVYLLDLSLGQLSPGDHVIRLEADYTGAVAETSETDNVYQRTITIQGQNGEIRGSKWNDLNGDGNWGAGEPGLANWQIFIDQNYNGKYDSGEPTRTTGPDGSYAFTGLTSGTYVICEVLQPDWVQKFPSPEMPASPPAPSTIGDLLSPEELAGLTILVQDSPPTPPADIRPTVVGALPTSAVMLEGVPTSTWTYGCSATSAGMIFGYYDRHGYPNMYTGPANGGVCPLTDLGQGIGVPIPGSCSIIATAAGFDGRVAKGHVDDYWEDYGMPGPDPFEGFWTEHAWGGCTADYMGTNQWKYDYSSWPNPDGQRDNNSDGSTIVFSNSDGSKLYDFIPPSELGVPPTECCHGMRLFAESRGYTVVENYTQKAGTTSGFTFANFQAEIDAGRPVMVHVTGHTMVGVGYDTASQLIYLHDTWDNLVHSMTWGGSYSGMAMQSVTVLKLVPTLPPGAHSVTLASGQVVSNIHFGNKAHLAADANDDGCVDVVDLLCVVYSFGLSKGDPGYDPTADFNHDDQVDAADLLQLVGQFGTCL